FVLVGISFLSISILLDLIVMYKKYEIENQLDTYIEYEDKNLNDGIQQFIKMIENTIHFKDEEKQSLYQPFRNMLFTDMKYIINDMHYIIYPYDEPVENFYDQFHLETDYERMENAKN